MARETRRAPLVLSDAHRQMLTELGGSRTAPAREVERAKVLSRYADGISISDIQIKYFQRRMDSNACPVSYTGSAGLTVWDYHALFFNHLLKNTKASLNGS